MSYGNQQDQVEEQVFDIDAAFDSAGGGSGAPSFQWPSDPATNHKHPLIGGTISGEIVDIFATVVKDATTRIPRVNKNGQQMPQFNITLKTDLRNWEGVNKIPLVDPQNPNSGPKPASEDTGERRIYVKYRLLDAISRAIKAAGQKKANGDVGGGPRVGAKLRVRLTKLEDKGAPNPLPDYEAQYVLAPEAAPTDGAWETATSNTKPVQQAAPADQWAGAVSGGDEPPF